MEDLMLELYQKGIDTELVSLKNGKIQVTLLFSKKNSVIGVATGDTLEEALSRIVVNLSEGKYSNAEMLSLL